MGVDASASLPLWGQDGTKFAYWLNSDGHAHVIMPRANGAGDRPQLDLGGRPMAWVLNDSAMLIAENYQPPAAGSLTFPSYQASLVDLATGTRQRRPELDNGVQFWLSPDRTRLAYLAPGLSVGLMDIASGKVTRVPNSHITYPSESIPSSAVRFNADGSALYWTNFDAGSTAWRADAQTRALTKVVQADGLMALAPDASQLLYATSNGGGPARSVTVHVRDIRSDEASTLLTYSTSSSVLPPGTPYDPSEPRDFAWRPAPPTPPPTAGETPGATTRPLAERPPITGVPVLDAAIHAVLAQDVDALQKLVHLTDVPCVRQPRDSLDNSAICTASETGGEPVLVLAVGGPAEGAYARAGEERQSLEAFVANVTGYDGAFWTPADAWPTGTYTLVFSVVGQRNPRALILTDDGITGLQFAPGKLGEPLDSGTSASDTAQPR